MTFEYKFAYLHYACGEYTKALVHINHILNEYSETDRRDVYRFARTFSLIIHYELGNHSLISYQLRSVSNYLRNRRQLYQAESVILSSIRQLPRHAKGFPKVRGQLEKLKGEMMAILDSSPHERQVLEYFDFVTWLDAKIEGISFREMKARRF